MTTYHLIFHDDLRQEINRLSAEYKRDPDSPGGREYVGVINATKALQSGREDAYEGKRLGYGPQSHDLRDCAELKVPVVQETTPGGFPRGLPIGWSTGSSTRCRWCGTGASYQTRTPSRTARSCPSGTGPPTRRPSQDSVWVGRGACRSTSSMV